MLPDSVNTPVTVRYCALIIKNITEKLNPVQIPVITADQPVYALGNKSNAEELENVIRMTGSHIEMLLLSMIKDWLAGSGWCKIFESAEISTPGRIDSFLKAKHVKRSRFTHQVNLATLLELAWQAYQQTQHTNYEEWRNEVPALCATAIYWFTEIELVFRKGKNNNM